MLWHNARKRTGGHFIKKKTGIFSLVAETTASPKNKQTQQTRRKSSSSSSVSFPLLITQCRPVAINPLLLLLLPPALTAAAAAAAPLPPGWQLLLPALQLLLQRSAWNSPAANYWGGHSSVPLPPHTPKPRLPPLHLAPQLCPSPFIRVNPPVLMLHCESRVHTLRMTASISITPLSTLSSCLINSGGEWEWHFSTAAQRREKEEGL